MEEALNVSIAPYIKSKVSTPRIMWQVVLALLPAGAAGVGIFGIRSLFIIIASVSTAVITEAVFQAVRRKEITVYDASAVITGLLLAYNLPPGVPLWMPVAGSFFAIVVGKQVFGGLGQNIFNPALAGRAFLVVSWPIYMTTWQRPRFKIEGISAAPANVVDALTSATPLDLIKHHGIKNVSYPDLFLGLRGGCIGEVCILALLIGAAYLLWKKYINWRIPVFYIATVGLLSWAFNGKEGLFTGDALLFILSGGLVLGAFFMATDYVTSPLGAKGKIIFGIGCGLLTFIIRKFAGYPEGVSYSILIMNAFVPAIERHAFPKWFGWRKK